MHTALKSSAVVMHEPWINLQLVAGWVAVGLVAFPKGSRWEMAGLMGWAVCVAISTSLFSSNIHNP